MNEEEKITNINNVIPKDLIILEKKEEPVKTLDNLFKKTTTLPHIYYLPLTEEEVIGKTKSMLKKKC